MTYQPIFSMPHEMACWRTWRLIYGFRSVFYKKCKERKKKQESGAESMGGLLKLSESPPQMMELVSIGD